MIGTMDRESAPTGSVLASDMLSTQLKKFTMDMPVGMHQKLKMMGAAHQTTARALIEEAVTEYLIPKYAKEVK